MTTLDESRTAARKIIRAARANGATYIDVEGINKNQTEAELVESMVCTGEVCVKFATDEIKPNGYRRRLGWVFFIPQGDLEDCLADHSANEWSAQAIEPLY